MIIHFYRVRTWKGAVMKFLDIFTWRDVEKLDRAPVSSKHVLQEYITTIEEQRKTYHFRTADGSNRQAIP